MAFNFIRGDISEARKAWRPGKPHVYATKMVWIESKTWIETHCGTCLVPALVTIKTPDRKTFLSRLLFGHLYLGIDMSKTFLSRHLFAPLLFLVWRNEEGEAWKSKIDGVRT